MINQFNPDNGETSDMIALIDTYTAMVSGPGKFEGNSAYVPYMWDKMLEWGNYPDDEKTQELWSDYGLDLDDYEINHYDHDLPDLYRYDVTLDDVALFYELNNITAIWLYEDSQGFVNVYEVQTSDKPHFTYDPLIQLEVRERGFYENQSRYEKLAKFESQNIGMLSLQEWLECRLLYGLIKPGFGYYGDTPLGESWGIVYGYTPNVASILAESNWEHITGELKRLYPNDYTIEGFGHYITPIDYVMIRLFNEDGSASDCAVWFYGKLEQLDNYPIWDENDFSNRESESDYEGNMESIREVISNHWIDYDQTQYWDDRLNTYKKLEQVVWEWLMDNDLSAIEHASSGYSNKGGYIDSTPIAAALYALNVLERESYDESEWGALEDSLIDYAFDDIKGAFRGYRSKL